MDIVPGGTVTVTGLAPGSTHDVWFFSTPRYSGLVTADARGVVTVRVPADLPAGAHRVVFVDPATGEITAWAYATVARALSSTGGALPIGIATAALVLILLGAVALVVARRRVVHTGV